MIRLTLNAETAPEIHLFNKSTILIGSDSSQVDLVIKGSDIQPVHLKIIEQNGLFIITNFINDPFISVNSQPFGKKFLDSGDIVCIYQTTLYFENLNAPSDLTKHLLRKEASKSLLEEREINPSLVFNRSEKCSIESFSLPFENDVKALKDDELQLICVDEYLKELESTDHKTGVDLSTLSTEKKSSLKDDYLSDLEDENQHKKSVLPKAITEPNHLYLAWKWILLFIFSLLIISAIIGSILYFSTNDTSEAQEVKAAQG